MATLAKVAGVAIASIAKVGGVAKASLAKVNGVSKPSGPTSWQTSYSVTLNGARGANLSNYSFRYVFNGDCLTASGSWVRITLTASAGADVNLDHVSIVELSSESGPSGVRTPSEVLFSEGSGVTVSAGTSVVSDILSFSLDETKDYGITLDHATTTNTQYSGGSANIYEWYKASSDCYDQQSPTMDNNGSYIDTISKIEVGS
jgi:hypothetical protein